MGSFDAGYGSALLARQIGQKAAREIFFLAREYSAEDMVRMGAVNEAVDHERLEEVALEYAADIARQSPQAIRMLKFAFNLADDGLAGQQVFAGEATRLAYMTDEAVEGKEAFLENAIRTGPASRTTSKAGRHDIGAARTSGPCTSNRRSGLAAALHGEGPPSNFPSDPDGGPWWGTWKPPAAMTPWPWSAPPDPPARPRPRC